MRVFSIPVQEAMSFWSKMSDKAIRSPFQSWWFISVFINHFVKEENILILGVEEEGKITGLFPFERNKESAILLGMNKILSKEEVTDYGDVVTEEREKESYREMWKSVMDYLKLKYFKILHLDYIRQDSGLFDFLSSLAGAAKTKQEVAPFIMLPSIWEQYIASLESTNRKELKRKLKRLETIDYAFEIHESNDELAFREFVRLHRLSEGPKKSFMTDEIEHFFWDIAQMEKEGWVSSLAILRIEDKPRAVIFFFENESSAMLYNASFDPKYRYYSPGFVAQAFLIKRNIETGLKIHDFMRGRERYKYDFGAKDIQLYKITIKL